MTPDPENYYDEEQVHDKVKGIMEESQGLVFGEFSMCNIDRFNSFYRAAKETGRTLVVDTKYAFILDRLREFIDLPDPRRRRRAQGLFQAGQVARVRGEGLSPSSSGNIWAI